MRRIWDCVGQMNGKWEIDEPNVGPGKGGNLRGGELQCEYEDEKRKGGDGVGWMISRCPIAYLIPSIKSIMIDIQQ